MLDKFLEVAYEKQAAADMQKVLVDELKHLPASTLYKLANGQKLADCGPMGDLKWLDRFKGTPLLEQAIQLEQEELQQEMSRMQERAMNQEMWAAQDQLQMKKKLLDIQLIQLESQQAAAVQAPPAAAPAAMPATPPAAQAAPAVAIKQAEALVAEVDGWGRELARADFGKTAATTSDTLRRAGAFFKQDGSIAHAAGKAAPSVISGGAIGAGVAAASSDPKDRARNAAKGFAAGAVGGGLIHGGAALHSAARAAQKERPHLGYFSAMNRGVKKEIDSAAKEIGEEKGYAKELRKGLKDKDRNLSPNMGRRSSTSRPANSPSSAASSSSHKAEEAPKPAEGKKKSEEPKSGGRGAEQWKWMGQQKRGSVDATRMALYEMNKEAISMLGLTEGAKAFTKGMAKNPTTLIGAGLGAVGGGMAGLQADEHGNRSILKGVGGALAGGAVGGAAGFAGGRIHQGMKGGMTFENAAKDTWQNVKLRKGLADRAYNRADAAVSAVGHEEAAAQMKQFNKSLARRDPAMAAYQNSIQYGKAGTNPGEVANKVWARQPGAQPVAAPAGGAPPAAPPAPAKTPAMDQAVPAGVRAPTQSMGAKTMMGSVTPDIQTAANPVQSGARASTQEMMAMPSTPNVPTPNAGNWEVPKPGVMDRLRNVFRRSPVAQVPGASTTPTQVASAIGA